jgi:hypothetical protein
MLAANVGDVKKEMHCGVWRLWDTHDTKGLGFENSVTVILFVNSFQSMV